MRVTVTGVIEDFLEQSTHDLEIGDEIEVLIDLKDIRQEVKEFAIDYYDLINEDDCECAEADAWELEDADMIDVLEQRGYTVIEDAKTVDILDLIDAKRLDEIVQKFRNGSFSEREEIYDKICGGKS